MRKLLISMHPRVFMFRATMCVYSNSLEWVIDFTTHVKFKDIACIVNHHYHVFYVPQKVYYTALIKIFPMEEHVTIVVSSFCIYFRCGLNLYPPPADGFRHFFAGVEAISFVYLSQ